MDRRLVVGLVLGASLVGAPAFAEKVIIKCERPCAAAVQAVEQNGGTVTFKYKYVGAIAADVPDGALRGVRALLGNAAIRKDLVVQQPTAARGRDGQPLVAQLEGAVAQALDATALRDGIASKPDAYLYNNTLMNLAAAWGPGDLGRDVKVAVIDSGIRPGFPHISLDGSVIGGEDFVNDGLGYSNFANGGHGTFVAGMISANVNFTFNPASTFVRAAKAYCPTCVTGTSTIPMVGSAPLSSIYAVRVFGPTGGAPTSLIMAAMERVLELRENSDHGMAETKDAAGKYSALDIQVCNMSLGGATLYAGRDIEDELTQAFLDRDIVLVTSAGNAGPSGTTGGSPGTGFGSLTVGAASTPVHERILRDVQYGFGMGALFRPFSGVQTVYFSSRGPTADGRTDPEVVANGDWSYGQGFAPSVNSVNWASGTSFSSPTVAGVAAVLRKAVPTATARQVRNAIIQSANPALLQDGSEVNDRGAGFVDAAAALDLLTSWTAGTGDAAGVEGGTNVNVKVNIEQGTDFTVFNGNVTRTASDLLPGQRFDTYYRINPNTAAVVVTLSGVTPGAVQNQIFGDDILLTVHSAKTSAIGEGDYNVYTFTTGGTFVIPSPELGLMRVTMNGDWTNASAIGATVNIRSISFPEPGQTTQGTILNGQQLSIPFAVPAGALKLEARLEWRGDWGSYPANDIDLILVSPTSATNFDGATLNNPERATIANPASGNWLAVIDGYSVETKNGDKYTLRITVDGKVLK